MKASVKEISDKGTTRRDKQLKKERVERAVERKSRSNIQFPSVHQLMETASKTKVDNDEDWKIVDDKEAQLIQFKNDVRKISFWKKMRKEVLIQQMKKVFPMLWKPEHQHSNKKVLDEIIAKHLKRLNSLQDPNSSIDRFMKWDKCTHLKDINNTNKRAFEVKEDVFKSCGTAFKKEKHHHGLGGNDSGTREDDEDGMSDDEGESDSEVEE